MTWNLTTNQTQIVTLENYRGLPLFSSQSGNSPIPLSNLNPQASYFSKEKKPDFIPTVVEELLPPTDSKLYVFGGLFEVTGIEAVYNINLIKPESYFLDLIEYKTYVVTSNSSLTLEGTVELTEDEFVSTIQARDLNLSYTFEEFQNYTITKITSEGLAYLPGVSGDHTFSFDGYTLDIHATNTCAPRKESLVILETALGLDQASEVFDVWVFDLSGSELNAVDSLTWSGESFMTSLEIGVGSLLFNRITKTLIAIK